MRASCRTALKADGIDSTKRMHSAKGSFAAGGSWGNIDGARSNKPTMQRRELLKVNGMRAK